MASPSIYAKAITAAVTAGIGVLSLAITVASSGGTGITADEWVRTLVAVVIAGILTWGVPNAVTQDQVDAFLAKEALIKKARAEASKSLTSND